MSPTPTQGTNSTQVATTAFVKAQQIPISIGWTAGQNPNNAIASVINQAMTVQAIVGAVEVPNGSTARANCTRHLCNSQESYDRLAEKAVMSKLISGAFKFSLIQVVFVVLVAVGAAGVPVKDGEASGARTESCFPVS
jgi:hypothetical protein